MSGKGAGVMANRVLQIVVAGVMLGAFFTLGWGQENVEYNFGVVPFFKNYPEYKRGYDPWSNLSGTVQENVDLYGGKLTLTVPLPGIPWSETTAFAPVLLYNSNIWSYRAPTYKMSLGGELSMGKDGGDYTPAERVMPTYKIADYWCNDAWMRFSPIGRTHNLPGWTLPVGGVYTEYVQSSQSIGLEGVDYFAQTPNPDIIDNRCYRATVEKKYFVAPDGSSHLLVDLETHCRPYFSSIGIPNEVVCELNCYLPGGELQSICLPDRECDTPIWYAVDGSGYYYLADQGKVYDKNGTTYSLDDDGMVSAITDRDGNTIHVQLSDTGNEKILKYTGPTGATLKIGFQKKTLVNGTGPAEYIDVLILKWLELPGLGGGGVVRYEFLTAPLIQHLQQCNVIPDGQTELRFEDIFHDAYLWCEMDGMEQGLQMDFSQAVFAALGEPSAGEHNAQIDVLTGMILPDGRSVQFEYNIAGKLSRIVYPDKGYRRYEYGNTLDISTAQSNCIRPAWGWHGKLAGQSPLGGVSLVWLDDGSGTQLERAYAYSGYNYPGGVADPEDGAAYIQTLVWMGDRSVQMYSYFPSDDDEVVGQNILQFGFTHWKVGKLVKTRQYSFSSWTGQEPQFEKYFLRIDDLGVPSQYPFNDVRNAIGAAVNKLAETESVYLNWDPGWQWEPPSAMCCASSFTPPSFYREVIPQAPTYTWNTFPFSEFQFPEWNTVVTRKVERRYEGTGQKVERRTNYY